MTTNTTDKLTLDDVEAILKEKGITLDIGGCGCCDSPWVKMTYQGRVFDGDDVRLKMHEETGD